MSKILSLEDLKKKLDLLRQKKKKNSFVSWCI